MKWILILFSVISMKTCDNSNNQKQNTMLNDTYNIITLNGTDVSEFKLTIAFKDSTKQVSGFSGCNEFFGSYKAARKKLKFGPLGATKMMCPPKFNEVESKMLDALSKVNSFLVKDSKLEFLNGDSIILEAEKKGLPTSFEYSQHSRNSFQHIKINEKFISVQNKRGGNITKIQCKDGQWKKLVTAVKNIDVENIPNLEAPSQKRLFDGAAIAKLKIIYDGKTYETPSFDHGNPHPDITNLVKEILSLAENIE